MDSADALIDAAQKVRANAYAPYSVYSVGAAVRGADGKIYTGCNVENVSFGLTMCAERVAIGQMVASGCRKVAEVAISTRDGGTPCGMCRQTLAEFTNEPERVTIWLVNEAGKRHSFSLADLIPNSFQTDLGLEN
ncbi:MAG: cytidine deaminase [Fimbriimonadaceae bacterium]